VGMMDLNDLKTKLQEGKVIIGLDRVMKNLKAGKLTIVLFAKNSRQDVKDDLTHYAKLGSVKVEELDLDNEELGVFCKKNFFVSTVGY
jgi:large subunit ribosomal protein L30e